MVARYMWRGARVQPYVVAGRLGSNVCIAVSYDAPSLLQQGRALLGCYTRRLTLYPPCHHCI